jgi:hypothetical protein
MAKKLSTEAPSVRIKPDGKNAPETEHGKRYRHTSEPPGIRVSPPEKKSTPQNDEN